MYVIQTHEYLLLDSLQLADRKAILRHGGFLVKRIAFMEPRVQRGVFLIQKSRL